MQVVIVGQDPYLDAGKANGLAFSVRRGVPVPYSLSRIFDNLEKDTFIHFDRPDHGDLRAWARQGVLLLNSSLTVSADGSKHSREWASFVEAVLSVVNESAGPTVFLLWGDDANDLADRVGIDENRHLLVRSTHPRREQGSRYSRFSDTNPFSAANQFLIPRWRGPIDWNL